MKRLIEIPSLADTVQPYHAVGKDVASRISAGARLTRTSFETKKLSVSTNIGYLNTMRCAADYRPPEGEPLGWWENIVRCYDDGLEKGD